MKEEREYIKVGVYWSYQGEGKERMIDVESMKREFEAELAEQNMKDKGVILMRCEEYNAMQQEKYDKRCEEWNYKNSLNIFPQIAFYFFWTDDGEKRTDGYVVIAGRSHKWFETKEVAEKEARKEVASR